MLDSLIKNLAWIRHESNPVLQPETGGKHGESVCMNPYAEIYDEEIYLYYAADDETGKRQICLTKAAEDDIDSFSQRRVLIGNGPEGSFDAAWCVLPNTITLDGVHYIYYTGNNGVGEGLLAFPGIGFATSKDGEDYTKNSGSPLLSATGNPGDPDRVGVAGGSLLLVPKADGCHELRYYYTGCPSLGEDYFTDQQKCICYAVLDDAESWQRRGAVMYRDPQHDYEDVAVAGPFVIYDEEIKRYRMWYSAIGTRWGYYSICYAESDDGIEWYRGSEYGENLQLGPALGPVSGLYQDQSWDSQMAAYPTVVPTKQGWRLFYTGNGYGKGGIGTALAAPMRTIGCEDGTVRINTVDARSFSINYPLAFKSDRRTLLPKEGQSTKWHGPDPDCAIWREYTLYDGEKETLRVTQLVRHKAYGIELRLTLYNQTETALENISFSQQTTNKKQAPVWKMPAVENDDNISVGIIAPHEYITITAHIES